MIFGPIFRWECLAAARNSRTYMARAVVGIVIGFVVWVDEYAWNNVVENGVLASRWTSWMGFSLFAGLILLQGIVTIVAAPSLFAGALADEAERRTLHDVLTTRLTNAEIVFDKMAARFSEIVGMLLVGLPFSLLLASFSGVDPMLVWLAYPAILSSIFFIGSVAMFFSCLLLRSRTATVATSSALAIWLLATPILSFNMLRMRASFPNRLAFIVDFVSDINDWIFASNPLYLLFAHGWFAVITNPRRSISLDDLRWMVTLQPIYAAIFLLGAIFVLRRRYRRVLGSEPRGKRAKPSKRRGIVGDAMFWKERRTTRGRGVGLMFDRAFKFGVFMLLIWQLWEPAWLAFLEQYRLRGFGQVFGYNSRRTFSFALRYATFPLLTVFLLRVRGMPRRAWPVNASVKHG